MIKKKNIFILGCGYVGSRVGARLAKQNNVFGTARSKEKGEKLLGVGINPYLVNGERSFQLKKLPPIDYLLISVAPDERSAASYQRTYVETVQPYLRQFEEKQQLQKMIYLSSTGVYKETSGGRVDENSELNQEDPFKKALVAAEEQIQRSSLPYIILRLSGIYGGGRAHWIEKAKKGELHAEVANSYINLIHIEDIVNVILHLFESEMKDEIILGCDGRPLLRSELSDFLSSEINVKRNQLINENDTNHGKKCSNQKLIRSGYKFLYPDFREGFRQILKEEGAYEH